MSSWQQLLIGYKIISEAACAFHIISCCLSYMKIGLIFLLEICMARSSIATLQQPYSPLSSQHFVSFGWQVHSLFRYTQPTFVGNRGMSCSETWSKQLLSNLVLISAIPYQTLPCYPLWDLGLHSQQGWKKMPQEIQVKLWMPFLP